MRSVYYLYKIYFLELLICFGAKDLGTHGTGASKNKIKCEFGKKVLKYCSYRNFLSAETSYGNSELHLICSRLTLNILVFIIVFDSKCAQFMLSLIFYCILKHI